MPEDIKRFSNEPSPADRHDRLRGGASWGAAVLAFMMTAAIVIVALAAPVVVDAVLSQTGAPSETGEGTSSMRSWLHVLGFQCAVVVLTLFAGLPGAVGSLGWRPPVGARTWLQPFLLSVAVSAVTAAAAFTFFADIIARDLEPIRRMVEGAPLWIGFVALAIGAPLSEELLFRGFLLHRLMATPLGFWGGALVANCGWTLLHFNYSPLSLADVFIAGLLFSWALWRTKSIWVPIAFHAIYNAVVFYILLIPSSKSTVPAIW